jgi:hypothetical protein
MAAGEVYRLSAAKACGILNATVMIIHPMVEKSSARVLNRTIVDVRRRARLQDRLAAKAAETIAAMPLAAPN